MRMREAAGDEGAEGERCETERERESVWRTCERENRGRMT